MSDKLVSLESVLKEIRRFKGYIDDDMIERFSIAFKRLPAVPREMTAREYLHHRNRICHTRYVERQDDDEFLCEKCVLKEACAPSDDAAEISKSIAIVEEWAREHPERSEEDG